jgi:hypothetical protein
MTLHLDDGPPPDLPRLNLDLRPVPPDAWDSIVRRAKGRTRRTAGTAAAVLVLAAGIPTAVLARTHHEAAVPAHQPAAAFNDVCDTPYNRPAPAGDTLAHPFRVGAAVFSPPGPNVPAMTAAQVRQRALARGWRFQPGTQLRFALVRELHGGRPEVTQLRWVATTCGHPSPKPPPPPPHADPRYRVPPSPPTFDEVDLVTDTGAETGEIGAAGFSGVCDTRLTAAAPSGDRVRTGFYVDETAVDAPPPAAALSGRRAVQQALRDRHLSVFPGTQIRLGLVRPLHTAGAPVLRWVVTTCGIDGGSVRPRLPGAVNELLVFDAAGRLLRTERSGPRSEAERLIATFPPVPYPAPTYRAASPNECGPWSHAYPDFRRKARAAGYTGGMQGCYLQANTVVIFLSAPNGRAAAAVYRAPSPKAYDDTYKKRFPYRLFTIVPAPTGTTVRLVRLLSPHVSEVELTGPGQASVHMKFDAAAEAFVPCSDTASTRAPCQT